MKISFTKVLYFTAFLIRIIALIGNGYFLDRPEFVTPISNIKRVKEALFFQGIGDSPYVGTSFHQPPIVLSLLSIPLMMNMAPLLFIILDFWVAYVLKKITILYNNTTEAKDDRTKPPPHSIGDIVALLYLLLPFSWTTVAAQSTTVIDNLFILYTLYYSLQGNALAALICLSGASYIALYPIQLLAPIFLLFPSIHKGTLTLVFSISCCVLFLISYNITESMDWIYESYGFVLQVKDLTPNIGLFWYFFLEVFEHFRTFFCCVLQLNCFLYVIPLSIRFKQRPVLLFWLILAYITTLKPYTSAADLAIQFGLLPLFYPIIAEFLQRFVLLAQFYVYAFIIMPIAWYAWLYQGSGNANFFYASTLVIGLAQVWLIIEILHISLEREYKRKHNMVPFGTVKPKSE